MANYNKVILMGNLTRDPELRYTPSGTAVADFGLAVNRRRRGNDGERRDEACFVDVTAWGRQAEIINEHFHKGRAIFLEGRLQSSWRAASSSTSGPAPTASGARSSRSSSRASSSSPPAAPPATGAGGTDPNSPSASRPATAGRPTAGRPTVGRPTAGHPPTPRRRSTMSPSDL